MTNTPGAASELLPCPFCGGPAQFTDEGFGFNGVECAAQGCVHMRSPAYVSRERMVAARAWNRRTPSAPVTEGAQREAVASDTDWTPLTNQLLELRDAHLEHYSEDWKTVTGIVNQMRMQPPPAERALSDLFKLGAFLNMIRTSLPKALAKESARILDEVKWQYPDEYRKATAPPPPDRVQPERVEEQK